MSLHWMPATELAREVRERRLSAVEISEAMTARVAEVNPTANALVYHDPDALLEQARAADAALAAGRALGPLHGVPFTMKDMTAVEGVPTTMGLPLLRDNIARRSAVAASRLQEAGGLFMGKTNLSELAYIGHTDNHLFGLTPNPWSPDRTAGGSSGGAAAAVVSGMGPLATGGDMGGSIRLPAAFCGAVGFKPSFGRVPVDFPSYEHDLIHQGPLARTVDDAALMFSVLQGYDPGDPQSLPGRLDPVDLSQADITGTRVAWTYDLGMVDCSDDVAMSIDDAVSTFAEDLGCRVTPSHPEWSEPIETMWATALGFFAGTAGMLPPRDELAGSVDEDLLDLMDEADRLPITEASRANGERHRMWRVLMRWFEDFDLLILPTTPLTAFPAERNHPPHLSGQRLRERIYGWLTTYPFNLCGACPCISVPCGIDTDGLPIGLSIVGRPYDDQGVLEAAACFERARPWSHHPPQRS